MFANADLKIVGRLHDTVVLAKLVDENRKSFQLRKIVENYEGNIVKFEYMVDAYKQTNKVHDYKQIPQQLLSEYANADVWNCFLVFKNEYKMLINDEIEDVYDNECELITALYSMERYGMRVDTTYEEPLKDELQHAADKAEESIYKEAGRLFNINSGKQLYEVLMELGVDNTVIKRTEKGNPKLDKKSLNNLADNHGVSIVKKILDYRKYEKLLTTYAIGIYSQMDSAGRIHGSINQTEARTGRMSITKPALQTLPKKDTSIRTAFIPEENRDLYFMDLDQVEYRLFAHYAKIPQLLQQIKDGYDVHSATAANLFNKDINEVIDGVHAGDKDMSLLRSHAKTLNFALIYGMGTSALANDLHISVTEATEIKARYFSAMPEAREFISAVHQVIKYRGFVKNFYGRHRRLLADECYKAPNSLVQGCAADYLKYKIVDIYKFLNYNHLKTHMINVIHDEIVIDFARDEQQYAPVLRNLLSDFTSFRCPITAGVEKGGPSWGEKYEVQDVDFESPEDDNYKNYNVYDGSIFDIYKK